MSFRAIATCTLFVCCAVLLSLAAGVQAVPAPSTPRDAATAPAAADTGSQAADTLTRTVSSFRVVSLPESTQVYLGDSLRGVTPCVVLNVVPGIHVVTLKKVGCYLKKAEITVDSTGTQEFSFTLLRPAFVRVESDPPGAEVSIDGKKTGVAPWENDKVRPGDYTVRVEHASYKPAEKKISVASAAADTVRFRLERSDAYQDSVVAARQIHLKAQRERFHGMLATALFLLGAVVIVLVEMMND